jgi:hypothetical protein
MAGYLFVGACRLPLLLRLLVGSRIGDDSSGHQHAKMILHKESESD